MRNFRLGDAKIAIINLGDLRFRLKDINNVPDSERRGEYSDAYENYNPYPTQDVLISLPNLSVLVDAGDYSLFASFESEYAIPNYTPPPNLVDQLSELQVSPDGIDYTVITHAHYDHYAGVTVKTGEGKHIPTFPKSRYLLGKEDFENEETQKALKDPDSVESHTFGVLFGTGLLELVGDSKKLCDEIEIIASPGETTGHKIVKVSSNGETLYCLGDLFHHASEVAHPSWMAQWDDPKTNIKSRNDLIEAALKENALLAPSHMPIGRLEKTGSGARFVQV